MLTTKAKKDLNSLNDVCKSLGVLSLESSVLPLPRVTVQQKEFVSKVFANGLDATQNNKKAASQNRSTLTLRDLKTLQKGRELNDEVINCFLKVIELEREDDACQTQKRGCYCFSTFFYTLLCNGRSLYDYQRVRRWTKNVNILEYGKLLVPIHLPGHWCLAVISLSQRKIQYYDSLHGSPPPSCFKNLKRYLVDEITDKNLRRNSRRTSNNGNHNDEEEKIRSDEQEYVESIEDWKEEVPRSFPRQRPGSSDCGVYLCTFAAAQSSQPPTRGGEEEEEGTEDTAYKYSFKADDMDEMRYSIAWLLLDYLSNKETKDEG